MSVRTASEQMAGAIGRELAHSDDETQAELFNEFASALYVSCGGEGDRRWEAQLCFLAHHLTPVALDFVEALAAFGQLEREARP